MSVAVCDGRESEGGDTSHRVVEEDHAGKVEGRDLNSGGGVVLLVGVVLLKMVVLLVVVEVEGW